MKSIANHNNDQNIFKTIFIEHWDSFKQKRPGYDTPQYTVPVQKMVDCGKESGGYSEYRCPYCAGLLSSKIFKKFFDITGKIN
ncbi:MAG: transposase zinc-binding domain-containing protein [Desulfamplus sp.]|nr:transposase zinc-binding domain-containing protein [Desulfamplus sp.]